MKRLLSRIFASIVALILCMLFCLAIPSSGETDPLAVYRAQNNGSLQGVPLTNEHATPEAKALYDYILSVYRNKILSGQQESTWISPDYEFDYIFQRTGKYPAIRGFDFIDDDFDGVVSRAIDWAGRGGIVTICWHCSSDLDGGYSACKSNSLTAAEREAILTEGTSEHAAFIANMDKAGAALARLQAEHIPVIWRPYHEGNAPWFWWGRYGGDFYKRLWIMTYRHFTDDLHLDNLIWMLGYSCRESKMAEYFPGYEYCDIVGADSYMTWFYGAEARLFADVYDVVGNEKPLAFHETGRIPSAAQFREVPWAYFMTWHTTYLTDRNSDSALYDLYNDPYVLTLTDLPAFRATNE